jgi:hypothetical protein
MHSPYTTKDFEKVLEDNNKLSFSSKDSIPNILEIAKVSNRELTVSNLYAYYLKSEENHGLGSIFLDSLLELIEERGADFKFNNKVIYVNREVITDEKKKYIDIVISDLESAIIIENKINASLYNDLKEYESFIKEKIKLGLILSVHPEKNLEEPYISITHQEFYKKIEGNVLSQNPTLTKRQENNYQYFIEILKKHYFEMDFTDENAKFYIQNSEKIESLNTNFNDYRRYILERAYNIGESVFQKENFTILKSEDRRTTFYNDYSFGFYKEDSALIGHIYLHPHTITPIKVGIWIRNNRSLVNKWFSEIKIFEELTNELKMKGIKACYVENEKGKTWALTFHKDYIIDKNNPNSVFRTLEDSLINDWKDIYERLDNILKSNVNSNI